MDATGGPLSTADTDTEKGAKREKEANSQSNRWSFIESQWSPTAKGSSRTGKDSSHRLRGGLHKRIQQSRQKVRLLCNSQSYRSLPQISAKSLMKKLNKSSGVDGDVRGEDDKDSDQQVVLSRPRCLAVVRGLVALLLTMDFTCHVDLFLVACKVLSKLCCACRPSVSLSEAVSQEQLERLVLLVVDTEFNHDHLHWGGPWAGHAVTCLLQDLLEAEKCSPPSTPSPEDSEADVLDLDGMNESVSASSDNPASYMEWLEKNITEQSKSKKFPRVITLEQVKVVLGKKPGFADFIKFDLMEGNLTVDKADDPGQVASLFHKKSDLFGNVQWGKMVQTLQSHRWGGTTPSQAAGGEPKKDLMPDFIMEVTADSDIASFEEVKDGFQFINVGPASGSSMDPTKPSTSGQGAVNLKKLIQLREEKIQLRRKLSEQLGLSHSLSIALDSRLEFGLETMPEHRLKVMQSMHLGHIQSAFSSPLPQPPEHFTKSSHPHYSVSETDTVTDTGGQATDNADMNLAVPTSLEMLTLCFERMFARLPTGRVSLQSVLQLWLTLNQDSGSPEAGASATSGTAAAATSSTFDPTRQPVIMLSENAIASLMEVSIMSPCMVVRTWVYLLQALCLLTNQRRPGPHGSDASLAGLVLNNANLAPLLTKLMSNQHPTSSPAQSLAKHSQMGPAAVKVFGDLLYRLQCKSIEVGGHRFKEMMLKIVYDLTAERGAIYLCMGQVDAQVQFVEMLCDSPHLPLDVGNVISVIQAVTSLVHQHLAHQDQVVCRSSQDVSSGARTCFGGLMASLLRGGEAKSGNTDNLRDKLMFYLLQLVNKLISAPVSSRPGATSSRQTEESRGGGVGAGGASGGGQTWADNSLESGHRLSPRLLSNVRLSDDEKCRSRGASVQGVEETVEEEEDQSSEMCDIVVGNPVVMQNLIRSLSHCNKTLALMFAHSPSVLSADCPVGLHKTVDQMEPLTAGDLVFTVLRTLKDRCSDKTAMVENLFRFFTGQASIMCQPALTRLSEPLLFFTLRCLSSQPALNKFIEINGVEVVGSNLVRCSQRMVSSSPSIISTLMQNLTSLHSDTTDKNKTFEPEDTEGMHSFAHLGSITCSSSSASPADGLIQYGANRRARSATWAYHFYPDEPHVELTIQLPFAVLLKSVHIRPHGAAISTHPSQVSLELSHDGTSVWPASPPLVTSSLSVIRLQLQQPAVVTTVSLILHRPLDSMTIGLQKISLCGQTAFAETPDQILSLLNEDCFAHSSLGWMQILYHCLVTCVPERQPEVCATVAATPHLLNTATSLLAHPFIGVHATKLEKILLVLGLSHAHIGLALLDNILRPGGHAQRIGDFSGYLGRLYGCANPYTVEILYRLGTTQDQNTQVRVEALLRWLKDCATAAVSQAGARGDGGPFNLSPNFPSPSPEHVQCVAAVLWHSAELPVSYPLHSLLTTELIRSLYDWSQLLVDSNLRKSVYHVLCSACHVCPNGFMHVQEWMGVVRSGSTPQPPTQVVSPGRMTDDSKADSQFTQDGMTDDSKEAFRLHSLSSMGLESSKLTLLASVCKSPQAVRQLQSCGLPTVLAQAVTEFCHLHNVSTHHWRDAAGSGEERNTDSGDPVTASLVSSILQFFTEMSTEVELQDWLGGGEGNAFWSQLLSLLCNYQSLNTDTPGLLSCEDRCELETRTIQFFSAVISLHPENQLLFAKVLCDVIKDQATSKTELLSAMPLSSFMRRLLLQVLLEDEKICVSVRNSSTSLPQCEGEEGDTAVRTAASFPLTSCSGQLFHPRYGSGRSCQCVTMNLNAKCSDIVLKVADTLPLASLWSEKKEEKKKREDSSKKKEALGEKDHWITQFGAKSDKTKKEKPSTPKKHKKTKSIKIGSIKLHCTVVAKEKREKSPSLKYSLPPRPPTRRGRAGSGVSGDSGLDSLAGLRPQAVLLRARLRHACLPGKDLPHSLTLSQLLSILSTHGLLPPAMALLFVLRLKGSNSPTLKDHIDGMIASDDLLSAKPFPSALKVFASVGGLALLAEHLPLLFPEVSQQSPSMEFVPDCGSTTVSEAIPDMITGDSSDDVYETYLEPITPPHTAKASKSGSGSARLLPSIPPHSLIAFGLFLRLPGYAEMLLKERKMAQCLLRLVLGVTDDGDGGQILTSQLAPCLATMPMTVLKSLFDSCPLTTDDGVLLRRMALDMGVVHLVLACLARLSHHKPRTPLSSYQQQVQLILSAMQSSSSLGGQGQAEEKSATQHYWAKGTGFGTGSTTSSWDAEQALLRQKGEEEHVACLLQVLASYVNPASGSKSGDSLPCIDEETEDDGSAPRPASPHTQTVIPAPLRDLLSQSCLIPALSSYLRNDSVLDMARHVPLYRALLQLLRGLAVSPGLVSLLTPMEQSGTSDPQASIETLLEKMKGCVDTYASRLKSNKGKSGSKKEDEESEGLALLIPDIQETAALVHKSTQRLKDLANKDSETSGSAGAVADSGPVLQSLEEQYTTLMKELQFDTFEMVLEEGRSLKFLSSHHYESNVKAAGTVNNVARTRRLAQEAVTLSTSLPLAFSSSVFVRCDEERLDVMKVLITGPSETPYANGCFEFDVFFPPDYPNTPPFINMETTGNHSVRFNPNLYNDGKVCLSILNTWHGRPEEKWNASTSSFLQVLVSIQSLILVSEPYFNEPGYERSRGTPPGEASSNEYDANIRQATVKWAMLEQLKNPSPCFKEIIHAHFWLKREEVLQQCQTWLQEMDSYTTDKRTVRSIAQSTLALKLHYNQLREELTKLKPPPGLGLDDPDPVTSDPVTPADPVTPELTSVIASAQASAPSETLSEDLIPIDILEKLQDGVETAIVEPTPEFDTELGTTGLYLDGGDIEATPLAMSGSGDHEDQDFVLDTTNPYV